MTPSLLQQIAHATPPQAGSYPTSSGQYVKGTIHVSLLSESTLHRDEIGWALPDNDSIQSNCLEYKAQNLKDAILPQRKQVGVGRSNSINDECLAEYAGRFKTTMTGGKKASPTRFLFSGGADLVNRKVSPFKLLFRVQPQADGEAK